MPLPYTSLPAPLCRKIDRRWLSYWEPRLRFSYPADDLTQLRSRHFDLVLGWIRDGIGWRRIIRQELDFPHLTLPEEQVLRAQLQQGLPFPRRKPNDD